MEQVLQFLLQQEAAMAVQTKQQGAHMAGLVQLQVQASDQLKGAIKESRSTMVQILEQSAGASVAGLRPTGMPWMTKDDDLELFWRPLSE